MILIDPRPFLRRFKPPVAWGLWLTVTLNWPGTPGLPLCWRPRVLRSRHTRVCTLSTVSFRAGKRLWDFPTHRVPVRVPSLRDTRVVAESLLGFATRLGMGCDAEAVGSGLGSSGPCAVPGKAC